MSHSLDSVNERLVQLRIKRRSVEFVEPALISFVERLNKLRDVPTANQTGNRKEKEKRERNGERRKFGREILQFPRCLKFIRLFAGDSRL